jgi:SOS response regulatory protein OraA/RecX
LKEEMSNLEKLVAQLRNRGYSYRAIEEILK